MFVFDPCLCLIGDGSTYDLLEGRSHHVLFGHGSRTLDHENGMDQIWHPCTKGASTIPLVDWFRWQDIVFVSLSLD